MSRKIKDSIADAAQPSSAVMQVKNGRIPNNRSGNLLMKKILYVLNDCMRKFSYERTAGLYSALLKKGEPFNLYILRSDAYYGFTHEHNYGEYNIYRLPDYSDFDGIILDINSVFNGMTDEYGTMGVQYVVRAAAASGKPVISIANQYPGFYYLGIDNVSAISSVIRHLHQDLGLTDFWFAIGRDIRNLFSPEKEQGINCHHLL